MKQDNPEIENKVSPNDNKMYLDKDTIIPLVQEILQISNKRKELLVCLTTALEKDNIEDIKKYALMIYQIK